MMREFFAESWKDLGSCGWDQGLATGKDLAVGQPEPADSKVCATRAAWRRPGENGFHIRHLSIGGRNIRISRKSNLKNDA
jgi:hypothetical protein